MPLRVWVLLLVLVGCVHDNLRDCGAVACPADKVCDGHGGCASPDQLATCVGKAEGDACSFGDVASGACAGGVCRARACGDGLVDRIAGEECDAGDANSDAPDAPCRPTCQLPSCGDGVVDPGLGEACDDGNHTSGDGCRSDCLSDETCGNGFVDVELDEQCDDGNTRGRDGCSHCEIEDAVVLRAGGAPRPRRGAGIIYDAGRQRVVMFGGVDVTTYLNDTWEWDGIGWTQMHPRHSPPRRYESPLAYDPLRHVVVLFGGYGPDSFVRGDTWEWNGVDWIRRDSANPPVPRTGHALAFDATRGRVILTGGVDGLTLRGDTWEWDGTVWKEIVTAVPSPGALDAGMVFDPIRKQLVLFGGGHFSDTWVFDNGNWIDKGAPPPAMGDYGGMGMAWDASRGRAVLLDSARGSTWEWNGTTWTEVPGATPSARTLLATLAYDAVRKQVVLFDGANFGDTWVRGGTVWSQPPAFVEPAQRFRASAGYDPLRQIVVMFGGTDNSTGTRVELNDTWSWNGRGWQPIAATTPPSGRGNAVMAYDLSNRRLMLIGGAGTHDLPGSTSIDVLSGTAWLRVPGSDGDTGRNGGFAFDSDTNHIVAFGGQVSYRATDTTTVWDGTSWTAATPVVTPPARRNQSMAYDPIRKRTVMFGGTTDDLLDDVWEWNGASWTGASVVGPAARSGHALVFDPDRGRVIAYGDAAGSHYDGVEDLWEWSGSQWTPRTIDNPPPSAYRAAVAFDPARHALFLFGGREGSGDTEITETRMIQYRSWTAVEACTSAQVDYDGDGKKGCDDDECWPQCTPLCPPGVACPATAPRCGDGTCSPFETCNLCPQDCGACAGGTCGDYHCDSGESHASCPLDC